MHLIGTTSTTISRLTLDVLHTPRRKVQPLAFPSYRPSTIRAPKPLEEGGYLVRNIRCKVDHEGYPSHPRSENTSMHREPDVARRAPCLLQH